MEEREIFGTPIGGCQCCKKSNKKIEELRKLLEQSEEINYGLQEEIGNLQKLSTEFRCNEKKLLERQKQLVEREQSCSDYCMLLSEHKRKGEEEITRLRQLLSQTKVETEKIVLQNAQLHEALVNKSASENRALMDCSAIEKSLNEAKKELMKTKMELYFQTVSYRDAEETRDMYSNYIEELKFQLSEKEKQFSELRKSSLKGMNTVEELLSSSAADINFNEISTSTSLERTLKSELDECFGVYPLIPGKNYQTSNSSSQVTECLCSKCSLSKLENGTQTDLVLTCNETPSYYSSTYEMMVVCSEEASTQTNAEEKHNLKLSQPFYERGMLVYNIKEGEGFKACTVFGRSFDEEGREVVKYQKIKNSGVRRSISNLCNKTKCAGRKIATWKKIIILCSIIFPLIIILFTQIFHEFQITNHCNQHYSWFSVLKRMVQVHYLYPNGPPPA